MFVEVGKEGGKEGRDGEAVARKGRQKSQEGEMYWCLRDRESGEKDDEVEGEMGRVAVLTPALFPLRYAH